MACIPNLVKSLTFDQKRYSLLKLRLTHNILVSKDMFCVIMGDIIINTQKLLSIITELQKGIRQ